ncbi:MAG: cytidylate kinase-like family protein, partial [Candidatus Latescibacterota bacterium]
MAVVTVARQAGAGGEIILPLIAGKLGFDLIDSFLLARVAEQSGERRQTAIGMKKGLLSAVEEWLATFITPEVGKCILQANGRLNPERYIDYIESVFTGLAERGNVIIVGRGGQYILRNQAHAFHIRLVADTGFRIDWMKRSGHVTEEEAVVRIRHSDAMRRSFISRYFSGDWDDPHAYHLVLNAARIGMEESADLIVAAVQWSMSGREYVPGLKERRKATDRRKSERRRKDRRTVSATFKKESPVHSHGRDYSLFPSTPGSDRRRNNRRIYIRRIEDRKRLQFPVHLT